MTAELLSWFVLLAAAAIGKSQGSKVTYDGRSLIINGEHKMFFSGSIHYPRSTPAMWPSLIQKAKEGGIDVIDTYVFWNLHEPRQGNYDFSGRGDIVRFLKLIQAKGLYVILRIGPFIEGEWTYGGFPFWLHDVPGITFRCDNEPFKYYMKKWVTYVVNMMKSNKLFASQGGPIIISQIENEYQRIESAFPDGSGSRYVKWAASMAVGLKTGVPWVMSRQQDAPDLVINTCNGYSCGAKFQGPNSPNKPSMWTENWTSFLQRYGEKLHVRTAADIVYNVALFIATKAHIFKTNSGKCTAFLLNKDRTSDSRVVFGSSSYNLPSLSISILKDCKNVVFNTTKVSIRANTRSFTPVLKFDSKTVWEGWNEVIPTFEKTSLKAQTLLNHMNTTKDTTDYLWYTFSFQSESNVHSVLSVQSNAHVVHAFVNGAYVGYAYGNGREIFTLQTTVDLKKGINNVALLSVMIGFPDTGVYLERTISGLRSVRIQDKYFTKYSWGYQVGLWGERLQVFTEKGLNKVQWRRIQGSRHPRLTWYKTRFDAPSGTDPLALNLGSMGKGKAWVNGQSIGRYWVSIKTPGQTPSQTWYHVPRSFLKATGNMLVLLEEEYGNPLKITLETVKITS